MGDVRSAVLILLLHLSVSADASNICASQPPGSVRLPTDIKWPDNYKISSAYTDWTANKTTNIVELRVQNRSAVEVVNRGSAEGAKWLSVGNSRVLENERGCAVLSQGSEEPLAFPPQIITNLPLDSSAISALISSFMAKNMNGSIMNVSTVAGIEGVRWLSCLNVSSSSNGYAIEARCVVYADKGSIDPASLVFSNPLILSLSISLYSNISDANSTLLSKASLEMTSFAASYEDDPMLTVKDGVFCKGLPVSPFPVVVSDSFDASVSYTSSVVSTYSRMTYDSKKNMTAETVESGLARIMNESLSQTASLVIHDINNEVEYVFTPSSCIASTLKNASRDVLDGRLVAAAQLFLPSTNFVLYRNWTQNGRNLSEYRASISDAETMQIVVDNSSLRHISVYVNGQLTKSTAVSFSPSSSSSLVSSIPQCFSFPVQPFSFIIDKVPLTRVHTLGESLVSENLARVFSSLAHISTHRFSFAYATGDKDDNTRVVFKVAEKPAGIEADEVNSTQFIDSLNATLAKPRFTFEVFTVDGKTDMWTVGSDKVLPYPVPDSAPSPSFKGYTGGAMFVLAIFMLGFGVAIGAGGVYVVSRRQRISTLAYQVFE